MSSQTVKISICIPSDARSLIVGHIINGFQKQFRRRIDREAIDAAKRAFDWRRERPASASRKLALAFWTSGRVKAAGRRSRAFVLTSRRSLF